MPVRGTHPIVARLLAQSAANAEAPGQADHRRRLLAPLSGRVIEVGAGSGLNFRYYPASVTQVVAVEPEPYLRTLAIKASQTAPAVLEVVDGVAEDLPADD